jgi:hypothetical protein
MASVHHSDRGGGSLYRGHQRCDSLRCMLSRATMTGGIGSGQQAVDSRLTDMIQMLMQSVNDQAG